MAISWAEKAMSSIAVAESGGRREGLQSSVVANPEDPEEAWFGVQGGTARRECDLTGWAERGGVACAGGARR